jgi:hypothetical protein
LRDPDARYFLPTLMDAIGAETPLQCDGRSLIQFLEGTLQRNWRAEAHWEFDFHDPADGERTCERRLSAAIASVENLTRQHAPPTQCPATTAMVGFGHRDADAGHTFPEIRVARRVAQVGAGGKSALTRGGEDRDASSLD